MSGLEFLERVRESRLYATVFVDFLGFALVLPSLPFRVTDLGGDAFWLGLVLTSYSLCSAIAAPMLGHLADRHGRRRLLLLSLAGLTAVAGIDGACRERCGCYWWPARRPVVRRQHRCGTGVRERAHRDS